MKNNVINLTGCGLKCDNPDCDYVDMEAKIEDYENWINKPCPKCGSNLLTKEDFDSIIKLMWGINYINSNFDAEDFNNNYTVVTANFDGSGKITYDLVAEAKMDLSHPKPLHNTKNSQNIEEIKCLQDKIDQLNSEKRNAYEEV